MSARTTTTREGMAPEPDQPTPSRTGRAGMSEGAGAILKEPWHDLARQREGATFGIWVFLASELLFFGSLLLPLYGLPHREPAGLRRRGARDRHLVRHGQHRRPADQQPHDGGRGAGRGRGGLPPPDRLVPRRNGGARARRSRRDKGSSTPRTSRRASCPARTSPCSEPAAQIFFALYWILTGIHAIHLTHRHRAGRPAVLSRRARPHGRCATTRRSRSRRSTGTSST